MQDHEFSNFLKSISSESLSVLDPSIPKSKYIPIDLSESNQELNIVNVSSSSKFGDFVDKHIEENNALVAYGGYLEVRNIYKRSTHFNSQASQERNIHLGIDLWSDAQTPIHTPLDATVHSYKNNTNHGDYGATIILEHNISGVVFYTLNGRLSLSSIEALEIGKAFASGDQIATLGDASINGDYPPHLHFQIIKDLQDCHGDYPGVCHKRLKIIQRKLPRS